MSWNQHNPIRTVVLDDHPLVTFALKAQLLKCADILVLDSYATSSELINSLRNDEVDLVILDYKLHSNELDGLALIRHLNKQHPSLKILVYSSEESPAVINLALSAGACGFLGKSQPTSEIITAVKICAAGKQYYPTNLIDSSEVILTPVNIAARTDDSGLTGRDLFLSNPHLTPKEREVLRCCLEGMSVSAISQKFSRSRKTISGQKQSAFRKIGIRSDSELHKLQNSLGYD